VKVFFHEDFYRVYDDDPAAEAGRMESVVRALAGRVTFLAPEPAREDDILAVHPPAHVQCVRDQGLYEIAALAAGGALAAARLGMAEPAFAAVRPPGHHASPDRAWGFCHFNNMAVALMALHRDGAIRTAYLLDFDLHYGDGNVNCLGPQGFVAIHNPDTTSRSEYLARVQRELDSSRADVYAVSAGFDNHLRDWGGVLATEDFHAMGRMVRAAARRRNAGCFGVLEGGYNHSVLGENVLAFLQGLEQD